MRQTRHPGKNLPLTEKATTIATLAKIVMLWYYLHQCLRREVGVFLTQTFPCGDRSLWRKRPLPCNANQRNYALVCSLISVAHQAAKFRSSPCGEVGIGRAYDPPAVPVFVHAVVKQTLDDRHQCRSGLAQQPECAVVTGKGHQSPDGNVIFFFTSLPSKVRTGSNTTPVFQYDLRSTYRDIQSVK